MVSHGVVPSSGLITNCAGSSFDGVHRADGKTRSKPVSRVRFNFCAFETRILGWRDEIERF